MKHTMLIAAMVLAGAATAAPPAFRVVVNPANPVSSLSRGELSDLFLKKVTGWSWGGHAIPVDQDEGDTRESFIREIHQRSPSAVRAFWQQRIFSGRDVPPPERESDADVLAFVRQHAGAIGYVSSSAPTDRVKVVEVRR
jgi:ABC-type phosphate transport system substrate-binding protein